MKNGQSVDPHPPPTKLKAKGVKEKATQYLHHSCRRVAVLPVLREQRSQSNHPVLPHRHLQNRSKSGRERELVLKTDRIAGGNVGDGLLPSSMGTKCLKISDGVEKL